MKGFRGMLWDGGAGTWTEVLNRFNLRHRLTFGAVVITAGEYGTDDLVAMN